ncbi:cytochrome C [uncultured Flavobacterium sp.]|uniref:c-type cytochrome n=1 Tax=uncultured Flavobacterium sp. TaxID=165435 RepID=UPI0030CA249B
MKLKLIFCIAVTAFLGSCSSKLSLVTIPVKEDSSAEIILTQNQQEGKHLFETNCVKCHMLYDPINFNTKQWISILKRMQPNTDLTDDQRELVYDYVTKNL